MKFILITEKFETSALIKLKTELKNQAEVYQLNLNQNPEAILSDKINYLKKTTHLIIRSGTQINAQFLNQVPNLEMIITSTSGFDHIDLELTGKKNIVVMFTPEANAQSTAELTFTLILNSFRPVFEAHKNLKKGLWDRSLIQGEEISGKTLGIVGLGRIGQIVHHMAKAFSLKVLVFDPYQCDSVFEQFGLERSSYEEVLKQSDILTFHVPLTPETKNMFNRSHLEYVNPDIVVINASRGSVVNEDDLAEALDQNRIKAVALDVFSKEPLTRESKLIKSSRALLTQHMGALTNQAFYKASHQASDQCIDFIKNKKIKNSLPLKNNWGSLMFKD